MAYFSSLGPAKDGRIKPDICGPGFKVVSAMGGGSYVEKNCGVYETFGMINFIEYITCHHLSC